MSEDVAGSGGSATGPFDLDRVREIMELMEKHGLTEVHLKHGDQQWKLRRGPEAVLQATPVAGYPPPMPFPPSAAMGGTPAADSAGAETATAADNLPTIKSPTVGTFYSAASPDDPPFVSVGAKVQHDTIVCIVEAMKVFNQIPAEVSGTIAEVLVDNGDAVEFGQPLFKVRPG